MVGLLIAVAVGVGLVAHSVAPSPAMFIAATTISLGRMGLVNPIATAMALEPSGDRAGAASALLGFIQMALAAALPFSAFGGGR